MAKKKLGNPAVVGLAGFAMTTTLLQFVNIGWTSSVGPVLASGFFYGGLAQFIAGFLEHKSANNFGFSAFVSYGAFWISVGIIFLFNQFGIFQTNNLELAFFFAAWGLYTLFMLIPAFKIHNAMVITFLTLQIGFDLLVLGHTLDPFFKVVAGYVLLICAGAAWYMMLGALLEDVYGHPVLPMGNLSEQPQKPAPAAPAREPRHHDLI